MPAREIGTVGVVGLGTMGAGIAQVCLQAGVRVLGREVDDARCDRAREALERQLARAVERGRIAAADRDAALGRLTLTTSLADLAACDLVIEAAFEDLALKRSLFAELSRLLCPPAVLATNTSALSVTAIASSAEAPERVVGMHFFNPAPVLPLVEVVRAELSSEDAVETAVAFAERLGKVPVRCADTPGFVVNRILVPMLNDAVRVLDEGAASPEDVDRALVNGASWPMGPFALIDLIGVDVHVHVAEALWQAFREPRFAPPPRLRRMLEAGTLGRKSGRGFYRYDERA
jgi:3-hydroxybutyryl-CoA dehydrogenase